MILILREWISANQPLIYFVYGLTFFVLGLSIILQSRRHSRLNIARSLPWLAAFGISHGLNEWGDVFIPIQGQFLNEPTVRILHSIHYIVLALSFAFLFQFGIELFRPLPNRWKWVRFIPMSVFIMWLVIPFLLGYRLLNDFDRWSGLVTSLARYCLCVPGSLLAGFGLLKQARTQFEGLNLPIISKMIKIAAGTLFAYSFFGGMIVTPSFYFPASVINFDRFTSVLILPPTIFRSIIGLILAMAIIRAMEVFEIETDQLIRGMEEREVISIERERIARDLHDGALQQVYAAGLMAQSLRKKAGDQRGEIERLISTINQAIDQLRAFLPQLRPEPQTLELIPALDTVIEDARRAIRVETSWIITDPPVLSPEQISHVLAFVSEALSNAIRHSHSEHVVVQMDFHQGKLRLSLRDVGRGLPRDVVEGFGLRNMRDRARLLNASFIFSSQPGKGTEITLEIPMEGRYE